MNEFSKFIKENKEKVYAIANTNTPKNASGRAMITKGDEWCDEKEWDILYKDLMGAR